MGRIIIGVMGPGTDASAEDVNSAYNLGKLIAQQGWVTLTGGRNCGVMDAASRGAKSAHGLTLGILPTEDKTHASGSIDIVVPTGIGSARNNINALASDVMISCGMGAGTASEVALALKAQKLVILLNSTPESQAFFASLNSDRLQIASTVEMAIEQTKAWILEVTSFGDFERGSRTVI